MNFISIDQPSRSAMSFEAVCDDPRRCRWPLDAGWCGAPTEARRPFCADHAARAYLPREADPEQVLLAEAGLASDPMTTDQMTTDRAVTDGRGLHDRPLCG